MESEYVAMSSACKDLFPIMDLVKEIGPVFDLPVREKLYVQRETSHNV